MFGMAKRTLNYILIAVLVINAGCASMKRYGSHRNLGRTQKNDSAFSEVSQKTILWPLYQHFSVAEADKSLSQKAVLEIPWFADSSMVTTSTLGWDLETTNTSPFASSRYYDAPLFSLHKSIYLYQSPSGDATGTTPSITASSTRWLSGLGGVFGMCLLRNDCWPNGYSHEFMRFFPASHFFYSIHSSVGTRTDVMFLAKIFAAYRSDATEQSGVRAWGALPFITIFTLKSDGSQSVVTIFDSEHLCWGRLQKKTDPLFFLFRREDQSGGRTITQFLKVPLLGTLFAVDNHGQAMDGAVDRRYLVLPQIFVRKAEFTQE